MTDELTLGDELAVELAYCRHVKHSVTATRDRILNVIREHEVKSPRRMFGIGDRLTKIAGSNWTGEVVGFYSTKLTPIGYCIESETEKGSVQIYPEAALKRAEK